MDTYRADDKNTLGIPFEINQALYACGFCRLGYNAWKLTESEYRRR